MTTRANSSAADLLDNIKAFERILAGKVEDARLSERLIDQASIQLRSAASATISFPFKAGEGMDHVLSTVVTDNVIDTPARRAELADNFVLYMQRAVNRAPEAAASRRAIANAVAEVASEAGAEGIDLELLRLEPSPINVFGKPRVEDEHAQVFYVHIVLPHLENGILTRDSYTIDADGAEEFADYLRNRTLPELREVVRAQRTPESIG